MVIKFIVEKKTKYIKDTNTNIQIYLERLGQGVNSGPQPWKSCPNHSTADKFVEVTAINHLGLNGLCFIATALCI